ncbi:EAL domain-containing protein [Asticcacaulis sp. AND118]|uniref:EAL domain-containing protein n=1 Tax=Asticcacaulis sp. AND118 TaxID=2840468 RepID=UPI001CFFB554|nr:EAL domain-containing protein [Asticcacaulis sp. AND118]UDF04904.1 EAL domain-containing protein [Asticcacaulis sp. AND118]
MTSPNAATSLKDRIRKSGALIVLLALSVLLTVIEAGQPLELFLRAARNSFQKMPVSGEIVVVGVDDPALSALGPWPWKHAHMAGLTDRLFTDGARRVFYMTPLTDQGETQNNLLAETFARHPDQVFVSAKADYRLGRKRTRYVLPPERLREDAQTVSLVRMVAFWGGFTSVPYKTNVEGQALDSIESVLSGVYGDTQQKFPINYAFDSSTVPYASAADVLSGKIAPGELKGKDVIVGFNAPSLGEQMRVLGQGHKSPAATVVVMGAETLKHGRPLQLGWLPAWLLSALTAAALLSPRLKGGKPLLLAGAIAVLLIVPGVLERFNIFADIMGGVTLLFLTGVYGLWRRFGAQEKKGGTINPVSGLYTPNAIRHEDRLDGRQLVAARIRRYAEMVSALPPEAERLLVKEIVARLELGAGGAQLYHGDDGNFFWLSNLYDHDLLIEQFTALHVIFRSPIRFARNSFDVDISFGVDREFTLPVSHRLTSALAAAHSAEQDGTRWRLHDPSQISEKEWNLSLLGELDDALNAGKIWVAYQPKMDLYSKELLGAEALVRWTHETRGPVSPLEFVEMAERHGRIDRLTDFVLNDALKVAKTVLVNKPEFRISVNISPSLLGSRAIMDMVKAAIDRHQVPPTCLILEVTETHAIAQNEMPSLLMAEFRAMGIGLSIDDYGTALSTLEYLRKIPATELKIDRRFTQDICDNKADRAVMKSTIQLAHALGMKAVAEGIETLQVLSLLTRMGCDMGQGYYIARPMDAKAFLARMAAEIEQLRHG